MCDIIEIGVGERKKNISIEYQRDPSLRTTELVIINRSPKGEETGMLLICYDNGKIAYSTPAKLIEGVDIVGPMRLHDCDPGCFHRENEPK